MTAWLGGSFLGEIRLEMSAEHAAPTVEGHSRGVVIHLQGDPKEVTLQVRYDRRANQYLFQLLGSGYLSEPITTRLGADPAQLTDRMAAILSQVAAGRGQPSSDTKAWMRQAGIGLWTDLVPEAIRADFCRMRDDISAFSIAGASDVVPWELLYPVDTGHAGNGFLVEQFPVMRRVFGGNRARRIALREPCFVVPPNSPADAMTEIAHVQRRVSGSALNPRQVIRSLADLTDVVDAGQFGILHFACHNNFRLDGTGSAVKMVGGDFEPMRLNSARALGSLRACSPLVFFNACRSAGETLDYTRLAGWASDFMAAGAGAFLGSLWAVRSRSAAAFADSFYQLFVCDQQPLGESVMQARQAIVTQDDPTWLAYSVYGDPSATATVA